MRYPAAHRGFSLYELLDDDDAGRPGADARHTVVRQHRREPSSESGGQRALSCRTPRPQGIHRSTAGHNDLSELRRPGL